MTNNSGNVNSQKIVDLDKFIKKSTKAYKLWLTGYITAVLALAFSVGKIFGIYAGLIIISTFCAYICRENARVQLLTTDTYNYVKRSKNVKKPKPDGLYL